MAVPSISLNCRLGLLGPTIYVTPMGRRFVNENHGLEVAGALYETGFRHWYCIFDDRLTRGGRQPSFEVLSRLGRIRKADSSARKSYRSSMRT